LATSTDDDKAGDDPDPPAVEEQRPSGGAEDPAAIPDPSVWRSILARWPDDHRLRWGLLANELEEVHGMKFPASEWQAFQETCDED
jgi:hypothetical protein